MKAITILGASGYTGAELVRLLHSHPYFTVAHLISSSGTESFSKLYPSLKDTMDINLEALNIEKIDKNTDAYVTALPHGKSMEIIKELYEKTKKPIVDLGADFRYTNINTYEEWYGLKHTAPDLPSCYGLCELNRNNIKKARIVGNPGCYTTCSILANAPLIKAGIIDINSIIIDAKSGATGAGKKLSEGTHFCEVNESVKAYGVSTHRHTSEIEEKLSEIAGDKLMINFTPHLLPVNRGIIATSYSNLNKKLTTKELIDIIKDYYKGERFIKDMYEGELPQLNNVV
ncbi:MAG: N-acetyl-gamma-glutamyl-phosphate reductase, partial [Clostridia bacterium]|nr:N-acetyl-gamma-glutamyl-phosphate reductase [Clostridia bacterium]